MKLLTTCLLASLVLVSLQAQGLVHLANFRMADIYAPILEPDGATPARPGSIYVQLHAGLSIDSLAPVGTAVPIVGLGPQGSISGFYDGGVVELPNVPPKTDGWVQVWAWDARATGYPDAVTRGLRYGKSNVIPITTGGDGWLPTDLVGLEATVLRIPEPSSSALAALGTACLLLARRRRQP